MYSSSCFFLISLPNKQNESEQECPLQGSIYVLHQVFHIILFFLQFLTFEKKIFFFYFQIKTTLWFRYLYRISKMFSPIVVNGAPPLTPPANVGAPSRKESVVFVAFFSMTVSFQLKSKFSFYLPRSPLSMMVTLVTTLKQIWSV